MVTMQEVADAAGVSTATVSRYLAGAPVRANESVARAISELGYQPSLAARALRSGHHGSIGLVVPDITNPFFAALVKGIERETRDADIHVFLSNSDDDPLRECTLLEDLAQRADGIIFTPVVEGGKSADLLPLLGVPIVLVDRDIATNMVLDRVLIDNSGGVTKAVDHLVELGHSRIAFISGPLQSTPGRVRYEGFQTAMSAHGLSPTKENVRIADFRESGGYLAMSEIWGAAVRPTAVVVANNLMTIGALRALHEQGAQIPGDVSVVGFDDLSFATLLNPPLTVVRRAEQEQGAIAARLLLERLKGSTEIDSRSITMPVELVVRGSTTPLRAGASR